MRLRTFSAPTKPINFRKFYNGKGYDLIYNCLVKEIDEIGSKVKLKLQNRDKNINVKVKNLTICAGGIESIKLILLSLTQLYKIIKKKLC